jgi:hypothetical protein
MMWYLQLIVEWAGMMLAQDVVSNAVFACLALWAGFGQSPRVCSVVVALVHLVLMVP